jgi:calcineurin-like phosphoesterase family protein
MRFFSSDHHFFHRNILKYEAQARPFTTIEEMHHHLITAWNTAVSADDEVFYLGDFAMASRRQQEQVAEVVQQLNGRKILIQGNHDSIDYSQIGFDYVHKKHSLLLSVEKELLYPQNLTMVNTAIGSHTTSLISEYSNQTHLHSPILSTTTRPPSDESYNVVQLPVILYHYPYIDQDLIKLESKAIFSRASSMINLTHVFPQGVDSSLSKVTDYQDQKNILMCYYNTSFTNDTNPDDIDTLAHYLHRYLKRLKGRNLTPQGQWLLHGHVHSLWRCKAEQHMLNVSVECWNLTPVSEIQIINEVLRYDPLALHYI